MDCAQILWTDENEISCVIIIDEWSTTKRVKWKNHNSICIRQNSFIYFLFVFASVFLFCIFHIFFFSWRSPYFHASLSLHLNLISLQNKCTIVINKIHTQTQISLNLANQGKGWSREGENGGRNYGGRLVDDRWHSHRFAASLLHSDSLAAVFHCRPSSEVDAFSHSTCQ